MARCAHSASETTAADRSVQSFGSAEVPVCLCRLCVGFRRLCEFGEFGDLVEGFGLGESSGILGLRLFWSRFDCVLWRRGMVLVVFRGVERVFEILLLGVWYNWGCLNVLWYWNWGFERFGAERSASPIWGVNTVLSKELPQTLL